MSVILETKQLSKVFGQQKAVDGASISVHQGDIYGLIGRNGAGKTTLMRMIAGLAHPTQGSYHFYNEQGQEALPEPGQISNLIENTGIYPGMKAADQLLLKGQSLGLKGDAYVKEILDMVGLSQVGKKPVKSFSMGMKQRLGLGLAMVGNPSLIILDEPINGLDPQGIAEVRNLITYLNKEFKVTFIISSHILDELSRIANRFAIIDHGQILQELDHETFEDKSRDRIEIRVDRTDVALEALAELGYTKVQQVSPNDIHIYASYEDTGRIVLGLVRKGLEIKGFTLHRNSLEEYYLALTGQH
jgi:ABC-type multidrug transport system ATPase subunit